MHPTLFGLLVFLTLAACHPANNKINNLALECGESGDFQHYRYVKLFHANGGVDEPNDIQLRNEAGEDLSQHLTPKACIKMEKSWKQKLIAIKPGTSEGVIFFPERIQDGAVAPLNMKIYRYGKLASLCQTGLVTSAAQIEWPIDFRSVEAEAFEWNLAIHSGDKAEYQISHTGFEELSKETIDISKLVDGRYRMTIQARPLFASQRQESIFNCELSIDRKSPLVTVDRELVRLDAELTPAIQAAPGEAITVRSDETGSTDSIFACLVPQNQPAATCTYDQIAGGFVTAPQRGSWILRLYALDQAGNQGPIVERPLFIHDNNLVASIQGYVEQSALSQKSGASLMSMIYGIKAYEKMKTLGSATEQAAVTQKVRKAVLESILLPVEDISFKLEQNSFIEGIGIWKTDNTTLYLQTKPQDEPKLFDLNGQFHREFNLQEAHGVPIGRIQIHFCSATSTLLSYGNNKIIIHDRNFGQKVVEFDKDMNIVLAGTEVPASCTAALFSGSLNGKTHRFLVNFVTQEVEAIEGTQYGSLLAFLDSAEKKLVIRQFDKIIVYDRESKTHKSLSEVLNLDVVDVKQTQDGSIAVLSRDKVLTVFNREGQKVFTQERVDFLGLSQKPNEIMLISDQHYLQLRSVQDGSTLSMVNVGGSNWSYLTAADDFIVGLSAGSNVVKIWTRSGNFLDEIYNKGDSIRGIWLSPDGYLYVGSSQYAKIFKLKSSLSTRQLPHYVHAVGLQFAADGRSILYKTRSLEFEMASHFSTNKLVHWDFEADRTSVHSFPQDPPAPGNYPAYGMRARDMQYFMQQGEAYAAVTMKRGQVAIYKADQLESPIETWKITEDWLLDLAVDPSGDVLAVASQNGSIYVLDRKTRKIISKSPAGYPVTLAFDKSGHNLFVADMYLNLSKYALEKQDDTLSLTSPVTVSGAGDILAMSPVGDALALVGDGSKLKLFDTDLNLISEHELTSSSVVKGQSVAFAPDGSKVYAGAYDGTWNELDRKSGQLIKVRFSFNEAGATNIVVAPTGDKLAFMGGGFVQVVDLDADRVYRNICSWLAPRLPFISDLRLEDRNICVGFPTR
jgi:WD40 repeat protein